MGQIVSQQSAIDDSASSESRRRFLVRAGSLALGTAVFPLLGACGGHEPAAPKRLAWLAWDSPIDRPFYERLGALGYAPDRIGPGRIERLHLWPRQTPDAIDLEKLSDLARVAVSWQPDVFVATWHGAVEAAADATSDIPVLFHVMTDPVADGLVQSMAASGSNLTGVFGDNYGEIAGKRVELLKECFPTVTRVAILRDPHGDIGKANPIDVTVRAAQSLGLSVIVLDVRDLRDFIPAVQRSIEDGANAVLPVSGGIIGGQPGRALPLQDFLIQKRLPVVDDQGTLASKNRHGLVSYAPDQGALFERLAEMVAQVFKGARPENMPVERASKFSLSVNLITARQMGVTIPPSVLARATEVIT